MTIPLAPVNIHSQGVIEQPSVLQQVAPLLQLLMQLRQQNAQQQQQTQLGEALRSALLTQETVPTTLPNIPGMEAFAGAPVTGVTPFGETLLRTPAAVIPQFEEQTRGVRKAQAEERAVKREAEAWEKWVAGVAKKPDGTVDEQLRGRLNVLAGLSVLAPEARGQAIEFLGNVLGITPDASKRLLDATRFFRMSPGWTLQETFDLFQVQPPPGFDEKLLKRKSPGPARTSDPTITLRRQYITADSEVKSIERKLEAMRKPLDDARRKARTFVAADQQRVADLQRKFAVDSATYTERAKYQQKLAERERLAQLLTSMPSEGAAGPVLDPPATMSEAEAWEYFKQQGLSPAEATQRVQQRKR